MPHVMLCGIEFSET